MNPFLEASSCCQITSGRSSPGQPKVGVFSSHWTAVFFLTFDFCGFFSRWGKTNSGGFCDQRSWSLVWQSWCYGWCSSAICGIATSVTQGEGEWNLRDICVVTYYTNFLSRSSGAMFVWMGEWNLRNYTPSRFLCNFGKLRIPLRLDVPQWFCMHISESPCVVCSSHLSTAALNENKINKQWLLLSAFPLFIYICHFLVTWFPIAIGVQQFKTYNWQTTMCFFLPFCSLYDHGHGHGSRYDLEPSTFPEARNAYVAATLSIGQCHGGPTAKEFQRSRVGDRDDSWVPPKAVTGTEKGTGPDWGG